MKKEPKEGEEGYEALPCPHGRLPSGNYNGHHHCPHCLGINSPIKS